jgi:hypothetical protein
VFDESTTRLEFSPFSPDTRGHTTQFACPFSVCTQISLGSRQAFQKGNYETNEATTNPSIHFACRFSVSSQIQALQKLPKKPCGEKEDWWRCGVSIPVPLAC